MRAPEDGEGAVGVVLRGVALDPVVHEEAVVPLRDSAAREHREDRLRHRGVAEVHEEDRELAQAGAELPQARALRVEAQDALGAGPAGGDLFRRRAAQPPDAGEAGDCEVEGVRNDDTPAAKREQKAEIRAGKVRPLVSLLRCCTQGLERCKLARGSRARDAERDEVEPGVEERLRVDAGDLPDLEVEKQEAQGACGERAGRRKRRPLLIRKTRPVTDLRMQRAVVRELGGHAPNPRALSGQGTSMYDCSEVTIWTQFTTVRILEMGG